MERAFKLFILKEGSPCIQIRNRFASSIGTTHSICRVSNKGSLFRLNSTNKNVLSRFPLIHCYNRSYNSNASRLFKTCPKNQRLQALRKEFPTKTAVLEAGQVSLMNLDGGIYNEYTEWYTHLTRVAIAAIVTFATGLLTISEIAWMEENNMDRKSTSSSSSIHQQQLPHWPEYTRADVAAHKTTKDRIWVTYKDGVYDITDFVEQHPGGVRILLAAGSAIDPFWAMYHQHTTKQVLDILAQHRIGTLAAGESEPEVDFSDPYANEPKRLPALPIRSQKPFNAETITELIPDNFITPNELAYKRHHHPVPHIKEEDYRLVIAYEDANILQISLQDLKEKFDKQEIVCTLQCAGNRRSEFLKVNPVQGLEWDTGAISTAKWEGVWLRDILTYSGLGDASALIERAGVEHIHFEAYDRPYDASIPLQKALSRYGDVLVAYKMNGVPIPTDHGGPVRVIVPGHVAARSVKWTRRIVASREESLSNWQRGVAYKGFPPNVKSFTDINPENYTSVQELPVQSAICTPKKGSCIGVEEKSVTVQGWAWSGGGRGIVRVDVSCDEGKTWQQATLLDPPPGIQKQNPDRAWAWRLWEVELDLTPVILSDTMKSDFTLCCRAVDTSYNNQPEYPDSIWNLRGILNNAWHRIELRRSDEED